MRPPPSPRHGVSLRSRTGVVALLRRLPVALIVGWYVVSTVGVVVGQERVGRPVLFILDRRGLPAEYAELNNAIDLKAKQWTINGSSMLFLCASDFASTSQKSGFCFHSWRKSISAFFKVFSS